MKAQLEQFKKLCETSDEEEQGNLPTSVEKEEEKKSVSTDAIQGGIESWKSYVMIPKNEELRDFVLEN